MSCMGRMKEINRKKDEKASKPSACPAPSCTHCTEPCSWQTAGHRLAPLMTSSCWTVFVTEKNDALLHWKGVFLFWGLFNAFGAARIQGRKHCVQVYVLYLRLCWVPVAQWIQCRSWELGELDARVQIPCSIQEKIVRKITRYSHHKRTKNNQKNKYSLIY